MKNKWKVLTGRTIKEWSEHINQHPETIRCRLVKHGTPYPDMRRITLKKNDEVDFRPKVQKTKEIDEDNFNPADQIMRFSDDTELYMVDDGLTGRTLNCLQKLGVKTIGDLRRINILKIDSMFGYGKMTRDEIVKKFYV